MQKVIICIDDAPDRYLKFSVDGCLTLVVETLDQYYFYTSNKNLKVVGFCLDFDMPKTQGNVYAERIALEFPDRPVVITSLNVHGANTIQGILNWSKVRNRKIPAIVGWEHKAAEYFSSILCDQKIQEHQDNVVYISNL